MMFDQIIQMANNSFQLGGRPGTSGMLVDLEYFDENGD